MEAGLQRRIEENVPAPTESGSAPDATAAEIDAQLSALLESVEADPAHVRPATERSESAAGATTRLDGAETTHARRRQKRARKRERVRGGRSVRDSAARETAYYVIAAVVMAAAASFVCTRLLT